MRQLGLPWTGQLEIGYQCHFEELDGEDLFVHGLGTCIKTAAICISNATQEKSAHACEMKH